MSATNCSDSISYTNDDGHVESDTRNDRFTVGFKLLDKFQNQWEQIRVNSEINVTKAKKALIKINVMEQNSVKRANALDQFIASYKSLPKLQEQINSIDADLKALENCFSQIEDLLVILRNHKENVDLKKYVDDMETYFSNQQLERKVISESRKNQLKDSHQRRVEQIEEQRQLELDERRKLVEQAFEEEKSRYLQRNREEI